MYCYWHKMSDRMSSKASKVLSTRQGLSIHQKRRTREIQFISFRIETDHTLLRSQESDHSVSPIHIDIFLLKHYLHSMIRSQKIRHKVSVLKTTQRLADSMDWGVQATTGLILQIVCEVDQDTIRFRIYP